jgi:hypothetical protein
MGATTSVPSEAGVVTVCASLEIDITIGGDWSAPALAGEAWRESMDSGALRPPRLSRGSGLSGSSVGECSWSEKEPWAMRGGGPELERHGRYDEIGGETGLLVLAPLSIHAGIEETATS